jgi:type I restriction enzyme, R subunit
METSFPLERLGNYCLKIGSGATPKGGKEVYVDEGEIALIRSQNVYNNQFALDGLAYITPEAAQKLDGVTVEEDDILLNITGDSVARCCSVPNHVLPARVNQRVAIIRPKPDEFVPRFIRYFLVSPNQQDRMLALARSGATRNALTKGMIEDFSVPKPNIEVQRSIAKILSDVPIFYEMQLIKLLPDESGISEAERLIAEAAEADDAGSRDEPDITVPLEELAGSKGRLETLAKQIVTHFEGRSEVIDGKAMIVCMSRDICMDLYDAIIALRPGWHADEDELGSIKVVMDANVGKKRPGESEQAYAARTERTKKHGRTKARRDKLAIRFKNNDDSLKLVIVCDMWLTGFDCPPLHTMYLDKPLAGHNLMQAIARVNRVFRDKPGGIVVDYLGIADQLRDAIQTYTQAGGEGKPVERIQEEAVPVMQRHAEELAAFFNGFNYAPLIRGSDADQLKAIIEGANYVLAQENGKKRFMNMVALLSKAFALAVPRPETAAIRDDLSFYQNVRASVRKRLDDGASKKDLASSAAVRQAISGAVRADGIIDLFEIAGLPDANVGILSDEFLDRLAALPQKNLALETLKKLLSDQIKSRERINIVQSRSFRESLEAVLFRYSNRAITTAQSYRRAYRACQVDNECD